MKPEHVQAALMIWKALQASGVTTAAANKIKALFAKEIGAPLSELEESVRKLGQELQDPDQYFATFPPVVEREEEP